MTVKMHGFGWKPTSFGNRFGLAKLMSEQLSYPLIANIMSMDVPVTKMSEFAELPSYPLVLAIRGFPPQDGARCLFLT